MDVPGVVFGGTVTWNEKEMKKMQKSQLRKFMLEKTEKWNRKHLYIKTLTVWPSGDLTVISSPSLHPGGIVTLISLPLLLLFPLDCCCFDSRLWVDGCGCWLVGL